MQTIQIDDVDYKVRHQFSSERVIIDFEGMTVYADFVAGAWMLSGRGATEEERAVFKRLVGPDRTEVTHTEPDLPPPDDIIPGDS